MVSHEDINWSIFFLILVLLDFFREVSPYSHNTRCELKRLTSSLAHLWARQAWNYAVPSDLDRH